MDMMFRLTKKIATYLAIATGVVGCTYTIMFPVGIASAYLAGLTIALSDFSR